MGLLNGFLGGLKISFQISKYLRLLVFGWILIFGSGCVRKVSVPSPKPPPDRPIQTGIPGKNLEELSPRTQASLRLTEQGRVLLETGRTNDAISMFERALNLDPTNGLNYYYLSEAWLFKGRFEQAEELNGMAEIYLKASPDWALRVKNQGERIRELSK